MTHCHEQTEGLLRGSYESIWKGEPGLRSVLGHRDGTGKRSVDLVFLLTVLGSILAWYFLIHWGFRENVSKFLSHFPFGQMNI